MLPTYKKVLYTTDLSVNAAQAFSHAVSLAEQFDGQIDILHVVPATKAAMVNYISTYIEEEKIAEMELAHHDEIIKEISQRLDAFAKSKDGGEIHPRVNILEPMQGEPASTILAVARKLKADIIVMGSHSRGALMHTLLGSVAEKVLRNSDCPVLISRLVS
jgi:nucleotide-binding universal stress UspA family protein